MGCTVNWRLAFAIAALAFVYCGSALHFAYGQSAPSAGGFTGNPLVAQGPHMIAGGPPPVAGTGCGTGTTVFGSDYAGHVLLGTGTSQPCTLTFAQPFNMPPSCVVTAENFSPSYTRNTLALNLTSLVDSVRVSWICTARGGG